MQNIITSLIFLFLMFAIAYCVYRSQNPDIQIKIDNLNILDANNQ
jgi:hypothetical protein